MASVSPDIRLAHSFRNDDDPPSPPAVSRPIDIPGAHSYANAWESNDYAPSNFGAYTPSYVGSFGSNQESAWGDREPTAAAYSTGASGDLFDDSKYEPEGYGSPYLVMDEQSGFATLSGGPQAIGNTDSLFPGGQDIHGGFDVDPRQFSPRPGEVFATGSPGSSIGIGEPQGPRSRASSMSSNHGAQSSPFMGTTEFTGQPLHDHFTKLSFNQSLDSWGQPTMTSPPQDLSSPSQKPLSPPTLFIPSEAPPAPKMTLQPEEAQPAINLVPATPVSGGGVGGGIQLPFQQMLANLNKQRAQGAAFGRGNAATAQALPPVTTFATNLGDSSAHTNQDAMTWSSIISASGQSQGTAPSALPQSRVYHHGYNVPLPDYGNPSTQQRPPLAMHMNANTLPPHLPHQSQSDSSIPSTSGIHLPPFSSPQSHNIASSFSETSLLTAPSLTRNRSKSDTSTRPPVWFDPASSNNSTSLSSMHNDLNSASSSSFNFTLTPTPQRHTNNMGSIFGSTDINDMTLGLGEPVSVRRTNSDGGRHRRSVKSEDLSSLRTPKLVPTSNTEFIRSVTAADGSLAPIDPRSPPLGGPGPQRRRGSGSGHERNSSLSSLRATPYQRPSPHTSPGGSPHHSPTGGAQPLPGEPQGYMRVERPLVTTPATKTASANRRRAEASFTCPVPGCGSTFTRHFNLRGHLRSHNEERPFKCKWPGCEKGFARQHDCKRHEALHLNIRPYTCEGCQKTFARMDALNRHLRSEGGVDCQKLHQAAEGSPNSSTNDLLSGQSSVPPTTGMPKIEQESSPWTQSGALVM